MRNYLCFFLFIIRSKLKFIEPKKIIINIRVLLSTLDNSHLKLCQWNTKITRADTTISRSRNPILTYLSVVHTSFFSPQLKQQKSRQSDWRIRFISRNHKNAAMQKPPAEERKIPVRITSHWVIDIPTVSTYFTHIQRQQLGERFFFNINDSMPQLAN